MKFDKTQEYINLLYENLEELKTLIKNTDKCICNLLREYSIIYKNLTKTIHQYENILEELEDERL